VRLLARCSAAAQRQRTPILLALAALTLLVIALPDLRPAGSTTLALAAALLLAILPHELAHAAVARLGGLRVRRLAIGFGPRLGGVTLRGVELELRLVPAGGFADIADLDAAPRVTRAVVAAAGPVTNLLLVPLLLIAATLVAGARSLGEAVMAAGAIGQLLLEGSATLVGRYAADPANLAALPIGGLPSTALAAASVVDAGPAMLLILVACLSAGVGLVNLLPWPPLDGAHIASALTGQAAGRRAALAVDLLLALVLVVNVVDALRVAGLFGALSLPG
jgi:membrane-associated protease RseP (regulator of RpoE activity)